MSIGAKIAAARRAQGLKQYAVAVDARLSRESLSRIERGHRTPHRSNLAAIAQALGVSPEDLEDGD